MLNRFSVHGLKSIIFMYPCCDDRRNRGTLQNETNQTLSTILNTNKTVIARHATTRNELWPQNSAARCPSRPAPSAAALCSALPLSPRPIGSCYSFGAASLARPHRQLLFVRRCPFAPPHRQLLFVRRRPSRPAPSATAIASALPLSLGPIGSCYCFGAAPLAPPHRPTAVLALAPPLSPRPSLIASCFGFWLVR